MKTYKWYYIIIIIVLLCIPTYYIYNKYFKKVETYNVDVSDKYSKSEVYNLIKDTKYYNEDFKDEYINIKNQDKDNFIKNISIFLNKGYNSTEINNIYLLSDKNISKLLNKEYIDIADYIEIKNFDVNNYERYINYLEKEKKDIQTTVTYVNIGLDKPWYSNPVINEHEGELYVNVNKFYRLSDTYEPDDLVYVDKTRRMRKEAAEQYKKLQKDANDAGLPIVPRSGYRSYKTQVSTYAHWVNVNGKASADISSARAGHSEHQTGLVMDVINRAYKEATGKNVTPTEEKWLRENSYKYGFIVRYPKGKTKITGYIHEPWHLRYLGIELATKVYESNLTYDEYYDLYIKEY